MYKPLSFALLILSVSFAQSNFAQDNRWYIDGGAKLSLYNFTEAGFFSVEAYTSSGQEYHFCNENDFGVNFSYMIFYELGGGYELTPWLNAQLSVAYAPKSEAGRGKGPAGSVGDFIVVNYDISSSYTLENSAWEILPSVRVDILPRSEYEDFSFILGLGYGVINRGTTLGAQSVVEVDDPVNQKLVWNKHVEYLNLNLGIEWRDYFLPKFGYFLRLHANPGLLARTRKIEVEKFRIDNTVQPLEGQAIKPGENSYPEEKHEIFFTELALGLSYQF